MESGGSGLKNGIPEARLGLTTYTPLSFGPAQTICTSAKPNLWSEKSTSSQRTLFSGGAGHGRARTIGVLDKTHSPLSCPDGLVDSMYRQPFAASLAQRGAPGFVRNSERAITSGSWEMIESIIRAARAPPPCWMFQERIFT